jgi:small subunit ribosomal protein S13
MADEKQNKGERQSRSKGEIAGSVSSIIRIVGKDVNGALNIERALDQVRGIGSSMAHALSFEIETKLGITKQTSIGSLTEEQIQSIERIVKDPSSTGVPSYMLNRNKDMDSGKGLYLSGNDLIFAVRQDVNRDVNARTWRGFRHQYGQRVRGQHTRSTGRTGVTVGVTKKAVKEAQAAALQKEGKSAAPAAGAKGKGGPAPKAAASTAKK